MDRKPNAVALAGGVGGARLARGLQAHLGSHLRVIVNTADDLERHGLLVSPDHDTVMYTLAGLDNRAWGWGLEGETFAASEWLARYGEETWFQLGDRDLATHVVRSARLARGERLTEVDRHLQRSLGVEAAILPMTDDRVRTEVRSDEGWLEFQEYFVHRHQDPPVREVRFAGVERSRPTPEALAALEAAEMVIVAPSNPIVSIGPILAVPGFRDAVLAARRRGSPVVAVSPIVGGKALKGPADRMLETLGHEVSALGVALIYQGLLDGYVLDQQDRELAPAIDELGIRPLVTDTIMVDDAARARLGVEVLAFAMDLQARALRDPSAVR